VDRGPACGRVSFETLLTRDFVAQKERPAGAPRTGAGLERRFGTTTTQLLHPLLGTTQASTHPRLMTREVHPKRRAVWTLERCSARLFQYAYEVYDQMDHPTLGQSPREACAQGMQLAGLRTHRLLPYAEAFLLLTCPSTRTGSAQVERARGIVVHG